MSRDIRDLRISLALHLDHRLDFAPRGPGWYLDARHSEGHQAVVNRLRIGPSDALYVAQSIDGLGLGTRLRAVVADANDTALREMKRLSAQADQAVERARRAAALLEEFEQEERE